jgi:DUF1680 family protein
MRTLKSPIPQLNRIVITDSFWKERIRLIKDTVIPYQWDALNDRIADAEPSCSIQNFRIAAGLETGEFHGRPWQDTDVYKWLEAVGYMLSIETDPELEQMADQVIDLIAAAQSDNGYLDTYFTVAHPNERWTNECDLHETYCAGHFIEAAVAYYTTTQKRKILDVACKLADHIDTVFGPADNQLHGYPGHEELELALIKLYRITGEARYLRLAKYFVDERGRDPKFFELEAERRGARMDRHPIEYYQAHKPVREQTEVEGHAVRAMYLLSAVTDVAAETDDAGLMEVCRRLWDNVTAKRMYITGGVGSTKHDEAFTFDYDLPNDTVYAETCASIGLVMWAQRMLNMELHHRYADTLETALYNTVLSGISLDGKSYFYVNPLEVWPEACQRHDKRHVKPTRQKWFGCACCPPNVTRILASLGCYMYSQQEDQINVHLYVGSQTEFDINGRTLKLDVTTQYPWDGAVQFTVEVDSTLKHTLALRVPGWCEGATIEVNGTLMDIQALNKNGYIRIERLWSSGDTIRLNLPMPVAKVRSHPAVRANAGKVAIRRGPLVYCLEEADNGSNLSDIALSRDTDFHVRFDAGLLGGVAVIEAEGLRTDPASVDSGELYVTRPYGQVPVTVKAIPYFTWANRNQGEMLVWVRE